MPRCLILIFVQSEIAYSSSFIEVSLGLSYFKLFRILEIDTRSSGLVCTW